MALKLIMASAVQAIASSLYSSTYLSINLYTVCLVAKLNNRKLMSAHLNQHKLPIYYETNLVNYLTTEFAPKPELEYPFKFKWSPEHGEPFEVAPGVFWLRMPLPISLDHINLWLLKDHDGWTIVDCGFGFACL